MEQEKTTAARESEEPQEERGRRKPERDQSEHCDRHRENGVTPVHGGQEDEALQPFSGQLAPASAGVPCAPPVSKAPGEPA